MSDQAVMTAYRKYFRLEGFMQRLTRNQIIRKDTSVHGNIKEKRCCKTRNHPQNHPSYLQSRKLVFYVFMLPKTSGTMQNMY